MKNWQDRVLVSCASCGTVYIGTPTRTGTFEVQATRCRRCGNTTFEPIREERDDG